MRLVHRPENGNAHTLAVEVELAGSRWAKARGLMFRRGLADGTALALPFDRADRRVVHMVGVFFPIDVIWTVDDRVTHVKRLHPMVGLGRARADRVVECPAGVADPVAVGDTVEIVEEGDP